MKKLLKLLVIFLVTIALVACGAANNNNTPNNGNNETPNNGNNGNNDGTGSVDIDDNSLYLITDLGTIDDKSFNQGSWEGMKQYADEVGVEANYLQPAQQSDSAYLAEIKTAVENGAKVVVTPGFLFANAVLEAQELYPEIYFILVDSTPNNGDFDGTYVEEVGAKTVSILYKEDQAGFLAGYAAVKEGFTELGFMGGLSVPAVIRFGYGFVAGANHAAEEMEVDVNVRYTYLNSFNQDPQFTTMATSWYNSGTEVIHAAAGGAGNSVMAAAEQEGKWVVGVDVDQKDESSSVLTSAMKNLKGSVYDATKAVFEGEFPGGEILNLGVEVEGVQISADFSRFETFTEAEYDALYADLVADKDGLASNIPNDSTVEDISTVDFSRVTVEFIE